MLRIFFVFVYIVFGADPVVLGVGVSDGVGVAFCLYSNVNR